MHCKRHELMQLTPRRLSSGLAFWQWHICVDQHYVIRLDLLFAICYLLFAICYLLFAICYLLFAIRYPLPATRYPLVGASLHSHASLRATHSRSDAPSV